MKYFTVATLMAISYGLNLAQAIELKEGELNWGEAAPTLTSGLCSESEHCSECRESWYGNDSDSPEYRCKDDTVYIYKHKCRAKQLAKYKGKNLCMTEDE